MTNNVPCLQIGQAVESERGTSARIVRVDESAGLAEGDQRAALFQLVLPDSIGQEPELTDADQAGSDGLQVDPNGGGRIVSDLEVFQHPLS
jgi:hypothetical protein